MPFSFDDANLLIEGWMRRLCRRRARLPESMLRALRTRIASVEPPPRTTDASLQAWQDNVEELRCRILGDDPSRFLRWPVVRRTMFVGSTPFVREELRILRGQPDWSSRWKAAVIEDALGDPPGLSRFRATSGNRVHHAYHLLQFERVTNCRVSDLDCIFEFGGGYGGMARLVHKLGFRGRYVILDLEAFSALQAAYLTETLRNAQADVHCVSDPEAVLPLLVGDNRLLLATWSLSEVPSSVRERVHRLIGACSHFLVGYQLRFEELDNARIAEEIERVAPAGTAWRDTPISHLSGNRYLIGAPRPA